MRERDYTFVIICVMLVLISTVIFIGTIPYKIKQDNTIKCEGIITEKRISWKTYIFQLNGTTDVPILKKYYYLFSIGDYIYIYESNRIIKKDE